MSTGPVVILDYDEWKRKTSLLEYLSKKEEAHDELRKQYDELQESYISLLTRCEFATMDRDNAEEA